MMRNGLKPPSLHMLLLYDKILREASFGLSKVLKCYITKFKMFHFPFCFKEYLMPPLLSHLPFYSPLLIVIMIHSH